MDWGSKESVAGSFWFKGFRERVKAEVLVLVQLGYRLRLLCIEGTYVGSGRERVSMYEWCQCVNLSNRVG